MRPSLRAGLVLSVVLGAGLAKAVCGARPKARVFPELTFPAPTNTHVWLELPRGWQALGFCDSSSGACAAASFEVSLESAPIRGRPSRVVPTVVRTSESGSVATVELVPKAPLDADSRYELWLHDRSGKHAPQIVGVLRTGRGLDTQAPTWRGLIKSPPSPTPKRAPRVRAPGPAVLTIPEECGSPLVVVPAEPALDEDSPPEFLRYAIWVSDDAGRIDYQKPPLIHTRVVDNVVLDGVPSKYDLLLGNTNPEMSDFERPVRKNGFRLGVRAVDWAGHMSEPSEIQLP